jgi:DNA-3-methyladenine glycosylase I
MGSAYNYDQHPTFTPNSIGETRYVVPLTFKNRCSWCSDDPLYIAYHDLEWGVPVHDDQKLFEMLTLEGAQAGLSWLTILKKRHNYRLAFDNFEISTIANYNQSKIDKLMADTGIVRNRLKIESVIKNARGVLEIQHEFGSFDTFLWSYVDSVPIKNQWKDLTDLPAKTELSTLLSKDLKKRGFNFIGPTICYSLMQAIGMVNDHLMDCFRFEQT